MSADRRALAAERRLDLHEAGRRALSEGAGDPYQASWLEALHARHGAGDRSRLELGTVVDVLPAAHAYKVLAGTGGVVWVTPGGHGGTFAASGVRPLATLALGQKVWFVRHTATPSWGTVLAAEPHWSVHTAFQPADSAWPFFRSGQLVDRAHSYPLSMSAAASAGGAVLLGTEAGDFSAGRHPDATSAGEWGVMAETGVGLFADPFQAYLRVDEATGLFVFYPDQLTRLAGHNLQVFSPLAEREELADEGELAGFSRECVYPWEPNGLWRYNQVTPGWYNPLVANNGLSPGQGLVLNDPLACQAGTGLAPLEPEEPDQVPAARAYGWSGYLGQGGRRAGAAPAQLDFSYPAAEAGGAGAAQVTGKYAHQKTSAQGYFCPEGRLAPKAGSTTYEEPSSAPGVVAYSVPPNSLAGGPHQPGLYEEQKTLTGGLHWRSAKRIIFAKRPSIPVPRMTRRPEDPYGDSPVTGPATYRPSGIYENVAAHKVAADRPPLHGSPHRAADMADTLSYLFNWEGLHPFAYHAREWSVAQEGAAGSDLVNQLAPDYSTLEDNQYLSGPAVEYLDVDHRYGAVPYYQNEAYFGILDDGTVVLSDGWGSEIRMCGGSIELRCAGDVSVHAGRDHAVWAGHDLVLKAHDCVDITAANGDLRTKAEYNSHHLAGNSGCGGFVFEAKSSSPAYNFGEGDDASSSAGEGVRVGEDVGSSGFTVLCPNSTFLVRPQDAVVRLEATSSDGHILLDAGISRHIRMKAKTIVSDMFQARIDLFTAVGGEGNSANEYTAAHALFGSQLFGAKTGHFVGCLSSSSWVLAGDHVWSTNAAQYGGLVQRYTQPGTLADATATVEDRLDYLLEEYRPAVIAEVPAAPHYEDVEVTLRTTPQYRAETYTYWESRWRQLDALPGPSTRPVWVEPTVAGSVSGVVTRPFPGQDVWTDQVYYRQTPVLTDTDGWVAKDRDTNRTAYETPAVPSPTTLTLSSNYRVAVPAGP